jgi:hypothetical protein
MCRLCIGGRPHKHFGSRRDFLKSAAATGIAAAGLDLFAPRPAAADDPPTDSGRPGRRYVIRGGAVMSLDPTSRLHAMNWRQPRISGCGWRCCGKKSKGSSQRRKNSSGSCCGAFRVDRVKPEYRLHKRGGAGQGGRGSSMESTEGTRATRSALTSDGAARVGRALWAPWAHADADRRGR